MGTVFSPPHRYGAGSSERRNILDSEGIVTWCTSSTGPSTRSYGTCRRRDARSTGPGARRHELHPGRPRGRCVQTHREGLAQRQDTFHRSTSGRSWTGAVATWTSPGGPTPDTCAWTSVSPSPTCTVPAAASVPSPGPRQGAQHQREHQRLAAPVLSQGDRPVRIHRGIPRRSRHGTQRQAPQDPGLHETQREDPRTDRRHRNINTNRYHQHQLSTKMLRQPLEFAQSCHRSFFWGGGGKKNHRCENGESMLTAAHLLIYLNIPLSSSVSCQPSGPSLTWIPLARD